MLEDAVEHGEDGLLLGFGEAGEALELALELGGGAALAGGGAGDPEEDIGGDAERATVETRLLTNLGQAAARSVANGRGRSAPRARATEGAPGSSGRPAVARDRV